MGEASRWWMYCMLRPTVKRLLVARIRPMDSVALQYEMLDMETIVPAGCLFK